MPGKKDRGFTQRARDTFDSAKDRFKETKERTTDMISENPIKSIIIAAAIGAIAGVATSEIIRRARIRENRSRSFMRKLRKMF